MDWLYAILGILAIVGFALLFGWAHRTKNTAAYWALLIICLVVMLWISGKGIYVLLILALVARSIDHTPSWVRYMLAAFLIGFVLRHYMILIASAICELASELESTRSRMQSVESKLDDISSRLPDNRISLAELMENFRQEQR